MILESNICIKCKNYSRFYRKGNSKCLDKCPENTFPDEENICQTCLEKNKYKLYNFCVDKCPNGFVLVENTNTCKKIEDLNEKKDLVVGSINLTKIDISKIKVLSNIPLSRKTIENIVTELKHFKSKNNSTRIDDETKDAIQNLAIDQVKLVEKGKVPANTKILDLLDLSFSLEM